MKDHGGKPHKKRNVGAGLSLEKFAHAKISNYNKKEVLQKRHLQKLNQLHKLKKIKHRLETKGQLKGTLDVKDNVSAWHDASEEAPGASYVQTTLLVGR